MSCEKDNVLGGKKIVLPGEGDFGNYRVRGEGDLEHRDVVEGDNLVTYLSFVPYTPPVMSLAFNPSSIEKGIVINKDAIRIQGNVTKGKETVNRIAIAALTIDVLNPVLPFDIDGTAGDPVALGNTEVLSAEVIAEDSKQHKKGASLLRPDRVIFGAIGKDPRTATLAELQAASFVNTNTIPGELMSSLPGTYTFVANGLFWFFLIPSSWRFKMKTDLNFNPVSAPKGSLTLNSNTAFAQDYTVYCNTTPNGGTITYQFYAFSKS